LLLDRFLDAIDGDHLVADQEGGENRHIRCNGGVGSVEVSTSLSECLEPVPHDGQRRGHGGLHAKDPYP
jgi:hypothetical protein